MHGRRLVTGALCCTALTGASGLMCQITWQRYLLRLLGGDSLATATVLGVFLGGLSIGYVLWGRVSATPVRLFAIYGVLEALIGCWALAFPWLYAGVDRVTASWDFAPQAGLVVQGALCVVVLIGPPTICMGATVPLLTRALTSTLQRATSIHAGVYAVNTAGALAGTLGAGFAAISWLGLPGTLRVAGLLNLVAAFYFLSVGRREGTARPGGTATATARRKATAGPDDATARSRHESTGSRRRWALHAIACASGFAFMTLETVIIRIANLSVGSSTYTLSLVIAAFLACTASGAFVVGCRRSLRRTALLTNQVLATVGLMALFVTLDEWPYFAHLLRIRVGFTLTDFVGYQLLVGGALCGVLAVPVGCMGATLPLVFNALKTTVGDVGRAAGALFAWNAAGNLLGGLVGGFLAFELASLGEIFMVVVLASGATCLLASLATTPADRRGGAGAIATGSIAVGAAVVGGAICFTVWFPGHDPLRFAVGTFLLQEPVGYSRDGARSFYEKFHEGRNVLAYRDDPEATLAVVENPRLAEGLRQRFPSLNRAIVAVPSAFDEHGARPRSILINGKADSSTFYDRETLRLAAHVPALLARARDRVLIVGLGTGVTAGELSLYPDVRTIEVAEISPGVVELLPWFQDWTHAVHEDPRLRIHRGDAFRVLRRATSRWNLIVSQPSNPWTSGVDQLFSREFYRLVRERLEQDGLFLQWIQRYATNESITAVSVNTLRAEFPYIRVFRAGADDLLLASAVPVTDRDLDRAQRLLDDNRPVRESLEAIRVPTLRALLAREHPEVVERAADREDLGLESLDRPRIHFWAGLAFFRGDDADAARLGRRPPTR